MAEKQNFESSSTDGLLAEHQLGAACSRSKSPARLPSSEQRCVPEIARRYWIEIGAAIAIPDVGCHDNPRALRQHYEPMAVRSCSCDKSSARLDLNFHVALLKSQNRECPRDARITNPELPVPVPRSRLCRVDPTSFPSIASRLPKSSIPRWKSATGDRGQICSGQTCYPVFPCDGWRFSLVGIWVC